MIVKKERKQTTQGRDGRTARRHHTGILRRGVWCASRRPPLGVCLFLSLFAGPLRFSLQPSCHLRAASSAGSTPRLVSVVSRLAAVGPKRSSRRWRMESASTAGAHGRKTDPPAGSTRPAKPPLASSRPCRRLRLPGGGTTPLVPASLAWPCGIPSAFDLTAFPASGPPLLWLPLEALGALGVQSSTAHPGPGSSEAHPAGRMIGIGLRAREP